ncbi:ribosomal protein L7Ae [Heterostelium album PN500]|uniref:H/ACA ribonucleoprotein complex subunit 2 n=1 Tax=Heterostelium pallidum (strain ATCC 26659 / Pp 5 / PN500) TaxID=670386 RepID=D3BR79_HETP5|nr:ribosomal protein L7Ae [Heterostelium album PN500]EFA75911.1 ribosomal protein L7Ae [Heterostelium album PN500]|eukprot:XP_020428045.1 ribosomal protein L7Ae [Heterostelium album PN500]
MSSSSESESESTPKFYVSPIASPMADTKLTDKVLKLVKKASKDKKVRRGVKEVVKCVRKAAKEAKANKLKICVIAGDVSPIDVISHIPVMLEEKHIKYIYVPSKEALGAASATKRPTSITLVDLEDGSEHKSLLQECAEKIPAVLERHEEQIDID